MNPPFLPPTSPHPAATNATDAIPACCSTYEPPSPTPHAAPRSYEDFVYFILSEEDKTTDASLDYWFR